MFSSMAARRGSSSTRFLTLVGIAAVRFHPHETLVILFVWLHCHLCLCIMVRPPSSLFGLHVFLPSLYFEESEGISGFLAKRRFRRLNTQALRCRRMAERCLSASSPGIRSPGRALGLALSLPLRWGWDGCACSEGNIRNLPGGWDVCPVVWVGKIDPKSKATLFYTLAVLTYVVV